MKAFEEVIGYRFKDISLLETALTHSSYASEHKSATNNERLEFLGDSVLATVVTEFLYKNRPDMREGDMTRVRAELVCGRSLITIGMELRLYDYIRFGRGELKTGSSNSKTTADALEAVFAAIYLDGGYAAVKPIIERLVLTRIEEADFNSYDYKTALQEHCQKAPGSELMYKCVEESGPAHRRVFRVEMIINGESYGFGEGSSKKAAEKAAARVAYQKLVK